jgi:hypothetical protein
MLCEQHIPEDVRENLYQLTEQPVQFHVWKDHAPAAKPEQHLSLSS